MAKTGLAKIAFLRGGTEHSNQHLPCSPRRLRITCLGHHRTTGNRAETAHLVNTDLLSHSCSAYIFFAPADTPRAA